MSTSLYYQFERESLLTENEWRTVQRILERYNQDPEIHSLVVNSEGEFFTIFRPTSKNSIVLRGSTKLPGDLFQENIFDFITVIEAWFHCLSDLRNNFPNGIWYVTLDDQMLYWNPNSREYERPK